MAALEMMIMSGPDDGQIIPLSQEQNDGMTSPDGTWALSCGRREECDISIPFDTQVSRQHAILRVMPDGEMWLVDAGSLNGTFVGNRRIEKPTVIKPGQLFRLGRTWVRVQPEADRA